MKYIMFQNDFGQRRPVILPEAMSHSTVSEFIIYSAMKDKSVLIPITAGFVELGEGIPITHGESESLGLRSASYDGAYMYLGDAAAMLTPVMATTLAEQHLAHKEN